MQKKIHHSFRIKVFCAVLAACLVSIGVSVLYGQHWLKENQMQIASNQLARESQLAAIILKEAKEPISLNQLSQSMNLLGARYTLMDDQGNVLEDTFDASVHLKDNHADRPEVMQAIKEGAGIAIRPSDTVGIALVYAVTRMSDGKLLRLAQPLSDMQQHVDSSLSVFGQIILIATILSLILAILLSSMLKRSLGRMISVVEAISLGNYQHRLHSIPGKEFEPLANAVNRMALHIENHIKALAKADQVRRDFVANVSHEFRTPLTAIQASAETIASLETSESCQRFANMILKNSHYLSTMVTDLLMLSRLESTENHSDLSSVDVHEVVDQTFDLTRNLLQARDQRLDVDLPKKCYVLADFPQLVCLLRNLVENASRHAPRGSSIRFRASHDEEEVTFRVVDDGPGIAKEEQERIFERFYQVERHRSQGTSGLGLAISRHIIKSHHGEIHVESPASDGATAFVFTLKKDKHEF